MFVIWLLKNITSKWPKWFGTVLQLFSKGSVLHFNIFFLNSSYIFNCMPNTLHLLCFLVQTLVTIYEMVSGLWPSVWWTNPLENFVDNLWFRLLKYITVLSNLKSCKVTWEPNYLYLCVCVCWVWYAYVALNVRSLLKFKDFSVHLFKS